MTSTENQEKVWAYLCTRCLGRANGRRRVDIAADLRLADRRLREALAVLVLEHGRPIGTHPRHGVYVCQDATDYQLAQQCLYHESIPTIRRMDALKEMQIRAAGRRDNLQIGLFDSEPVVP